MLQQGDADIIPHSSASGMRGMAAYLIMLMSGQEGRSNQLVLQGMKALRGLYMEQWSDLLMDLAM